MSDPYQRSAEYIDLLLEEQWRPLTPLLCAELGRLGAQQGRVVDIGAGTGRGVRALCAALPGVPVTAVEPSAAMRTALRVRLADDPALRERVTVVAGDALSVPLEWPLRAVAALNVLGHLPPPDRRELWARAAGALVPGGAVLVNVPQPPVPRRVQVACNGRAMLGERLYQGWAGAEPAGAERIVWHMTYETWRGEELLERVTADYDWWVAPQEELHAEWAAAGLHGRAVGDPHGALFVLTPQR